MNARAASGGAFGAWRWGRGGYRVCPLSHHRRSADAGEQFPERETLTGILHALKGHFEGKNVYFGSDMFIYYREGPNPERVAPDVFVVMGERYELEKVYLPSEHRGRLPEFVLEVLSPSTRKYDQTTKKDLYRDLGVQEYFLFDSEAAASERAIWAYRLVGGRFEPMLPAGMVSGEEEYASRVLGLGFRRDGAHVRVRDLAAGLDYAWPEEDRQARLSETRRRKRAEARQRQAEAERRAESARRQKVEAEASALLQRLDELEAKLRAGRS